MKGLKKMKLTQLNKIELEEREMDLLVGGCNALCGCRNESTHPHNANANMNYGYHVSGGSCEVQTFGTYYIPEIEINGKC